MKKLLLFLSLTVWAEAGFAQGKVSLQLDGGSAITMPADPYYIMDGDLGFLGQQVPTTGPLPSGSVLRVGLYAGTSSTSLSLTSSTLLNPAGGTGNAPGIIPVVHIYLPFAGGTLAYFQVRIWDSRYASYEAWTAAFQQFGDYAYAGENNMFTMTPGTSVTYPSIINGGNSTWAAAGNESTTAFNLVAVYIPEPSILALAGLGAALLLAVCRCKRF